MRPEHSPLPEFNGPMPVASRVRDPKGALQPYVEAVRSHALLVALVLAIVVGASMAWLALRSPNYSAEAEIFVTPLPAETVSLVGIPLLQDLRDPTRTIQTAAAIVESQGAARRTAQILGPPWTAERVKKAVNVLPKGETNILEVVAVAESPELAARVANVYAGSALAVRRETLQRLARTAIPSLRARLRELPPGSPGTAEVQSALTRLEALRRGQDPTLSLAQTAVPPSAALGATGRMILLLAILAGAVLAVATAVAVERITPRRIMSEEELVEVCPLPILARLPILPRQNRDVHALELDPETREALRSVQVQLDIAGEQPKVIMITSPSPADGKTTTSLQLAVSIAGGGSRVILIDTDVRRKPIRTELTADAERIQPVWLREAMPRGGRSTESGRPSLRPLLHRVIGHPNLQLLHAVDIGFDTADPHSRARFADLTRAAAQEADYVILDTPPVGMISDALTFAPLVDHVLLVARIRSSMRLHLEVARDLLYRVGLRPDGYLVISERTLGSYAYSTAGSLVG